MPTPPAEELSPAQESELRAQLVALEAELRAQIESHAEGVKPVDLDQPIGRVSRVDALQQQQMAAATRRNLQMRLRQVAAALAAVDSGDYGFCRRCDEPIGYGRLKARPESPFCVHCQSGLEQR